MREKTFGQLIKESHTLIPPNTLPPLYSQDEVADPIVHVKLFNPAGSWTWYLTECDAEGKLAFGWVDGDFQELGYVDIDELKSVRLPMGLKIERDLYWNAKPLSVAIATP